MLTGLAALIIILAGAGGIAWVILAVAVGAAYTIVAMLTRSEP